MKFAIGVFDNQRNRTILEGARTDQNGIFVILEKFTALDPSGRNQFLREVIGLGVAAYKSEDDDGELHYSITAMKL